MWDFEISYDPRTGIGLDAPIGSEAKITAGDVTTVLKYGPNLTDWRDTSSVDTFLLNRANHTGTQLGSTISNFASIALSTLLAGLSVATNTAVISTDSILIAIGKLQAQLNNIFANGITYNEVSSPSTPSAGLIDYALDLGRQMFTYKTAQGQEITLQPHLGRKSFCQYVPNVNTNVMSAIGGTALTATGTATARTVATSNFFTPARRIGYVSAATASASAGVRSATAYLLRGTTSRTGGFHTIFKFGISDVAAVAGARTFVGLTASTTLLAINTSEPSALLNQIGMYNDSADANFSIICVGGASSTKIALGANFPANTRNADMYELVLFAPQAGGGIFVNYKVTNLSTNIVATGSITTTLPSSNTALAPQIVRSNNATALAVGIDIASIYIESDN